MRDSSILRLSQLETLLSAAESVTFKTTDFSKLICLPMAGGKDMAPFCFDRFTYKVDGEISKNIFLLSAIYTAFIEQVETAIMDKDSAIFYINRNNAEAAFNHQPNKLHDISIDENNHIMTIWSTGIVGVINSAVTIKSVIEKYASLSQDEELLQGLQEIEDDGKSITIHYEVRSRFDDERYPFFLATMLMRNYKASNCYVPENEDNLYDFMMLFRFMFSLQHAYRKGFYKKYKRFGANDMKLKGNIDFPKYIRNNLAVEDGRISYSYRENSVDNELNHLILAAFRFLKQKYPMMVKYNFESNLELKKIISTLEEYLLFSKKYDYKQLIEMNSDKIVHPFYRDYDDLRLTCISILKHGALSFWNGDSKSTLKGTLYYIPGLWEELLEDVLKTSSKVNYELISQAPIKVLGDLKTTYPDFLFQNKENRTNILMLDAKFRPYWKDVYKGERFSSYLLGDFDKCIRDMVTTNSKHTGVIFPMGIEDDTENSAGVEHIISEYNPTNKFYTIPVTIPKYVEEKLQNKKSRKKNMESPDRLQQYLEWKTEFDKSCSKLVDRISAIVEENI